MADAPRLRRHRSSTSRSNAPPVTDSVNVLFNCIQQLAGDALTEDDVITRLDQLITTLRHEADLEVLQDHFRRQHGFQALLAVLNSRLDSPIESLSTNIFRVLTIFSLAFRQHDGNRRYFARRIEDGGWSSLAIVLGSFRNKAWAADRSHALRLLSSLATALLSLATGDDQTGGSSNGSHADQTSLLVESERDDLAQLHDVTKKLKPTAKVIHPQALLLLRTVCMSNSMSTGPPNELQLSFLTNLNTLTQEDPSNQDRIAESGIIDTLLDFVVEETTTPTEHALLDSIIPRLLRFHATPLTTAERLFRSASTNSRVRNILEHVTSHPKHAPCIRFDLSRIGHASLEIPCLPRAFPPPTGYTLTAWIRIDQFDPRHHTTIFGAFDATQTCFVLAYIEQGSNQLILQTSVTSTSPSVRFKRFRFKTGFWYHLAIVHRPPKTGPFGEATLYINGRHVERKDSCLYPLPAPLHGTAANLPSFSPDMNIRRPVQAFFGTPRDLVVGAEAEYPASTWCLASAHLYDLCLSRDLVAVQHSLGPAYLGNFQDRVGSFLTYDASAALNRYSEELYGEKAETSSIATTTQSRGSDAVHEGSNLLSIFSTSVVNPNTDGPLEMAAPLTSSLPEIAARELQHATRTGNTIIFNANRPLLADALARPYGVAVLTGSTSVSIPHPLDDAAWQLSGFNGIHSMLLQTASTPEDLRSSVRLLCQSIKYNFRACDAMERDDGYSIIALLIREKLGLAGTPGAGTKTGTGITFVTPEDRDHTMVDLLETILDFLGINKAHPESSMITNPMAYRKLLTDLDTWRSGSASCQRLFYEHFCWLLDNENPNMLFNSKRISQMRVVRRFIDCLRSDMIYEENVEYLLDAFELLFDHAANKHDLRDLFTFIGYRLQEDKPAVVSTTAPKSRSISIAFSDQRPATPTESVSDLPLMTSQRSLLSKVQLGRELMQAYSGLLCEPNSAHLLRRIYRSIPVSWLLNLLDNKHPNVVESTFRMMCRSIVTIGSEYLDRLTTKNAGFYIVRTRISPHWQQPGLWMACFAVIFGMDIARIDNAVAFTEESLQSAFPPLRLTVKNSGCLQWLLGLLEAGMNHALNGDANKDQAAVDSNNDIMQVAVGFLSDLHQRNQSFRDLTNSSQCLKDLLRISYPSIADTAIAEASHELSELDLTTDSAEDTLLRPHSSSISGGRPTIIRSGSSITLPSRPSSKKLRTPRRPSSFVMVDAADSTEVRLSAHFSTFMAPAKGKLPDTPVISSTADKLLDIFVTNLIDQACLRKDFSGFGLFLKVPPGDKVHQAYFSSYVLLRTMSQLWTHLMANESLLRSPRTLTNLAKYSLHMAEAVFEGWFMDGAQPLVDFAGKLLDYVQRPEVANLKEVRLCSQATSTIRTVFLRIVLLRLSELDETDSDGETLRFFNQLTYWQTILFAPENQETPFIRLICYVLYTKLVSSSPAVRIAAAALFRMLLVLKPTEAATILVHNTDGSQKHLSTGFMKLATHDDEELLQWVDKRRDALDNFFLETLAVHWEEFVDSENQKTEESARNRIAKRREELKKWRSEEQSLAGHLHQAQRSSDHWRLNSFSQNHMKLNRTLQDQQEDIRSFQAALARQQELMQQPCGLTPDESPVKWQLDRTESRDRMRVRLLRDRQRGTHEYQPKRKLSQRVLTAWDKDRAGVRSSSVGSHSSAQSRNGNNGVRSASGEVVVNTSEPTDQSAVSLLEGDFELIDDPRDDQELFEDKNRKILRSVKRGDSIRAVYNVSRIAGLEACEGLVIIGRSHLYMRDHMFQRRDKEIVGINHAPPEERDVYVQMISGREVRSSRNVRASAAEDLAKCWAWKDVISMSKRRFLFRSVAIEIFFNDGRSYLLIFASPQIRDSVYSDSARQAPHITGPTSSMSEEDQWRLDSLRGPEDIPQTLGNKFASVFNSASGNSATRKWMRGEISNFNYLMLVNTMAGRTFNDLTQYPVFPWVLADYSSDELDLDDPRSFRDLSKPMGCQNNAREAEFRERYQTFAEMGDERPFHYGTHYSSAMIVTSYLIRLQPFVQSYLLLQGGSFDHADRLFDSVEKAWIQSSKQNMTDVRELTPEFYYLPEFLTNLNGYDFGVKEGSGQAIGDVILPKWAKGDPHLFIKKHREALESPRVSEHLHEWIDLVFGYKQKGEAAVEATNVFHPLSYHGAKDLDSIDDPVERLATIGIIHNFGQTPHQVFTRPHPRREQERHEIQRLDSQADTLTRLPKPVAELSERIGGIMQVPATNKVLASGACKLFSPPNGKFFAQWQYADNSLRFFDTDSRKLLGLFEELHIGPLSTGLFIDSKTFLTGGTDCTIGVWEIITSSTEHLDLRPKQHLFGHRQPITHLAVSRVFSTIISASADGQVLMWDLNRFDCIRILQPADSTRPVSAIRISNLNGTILVSSGPSVRLLTINGHLLLDQRLGDDHNDPVTCAAFYDGHSPAEWVGTQLVFTGHRRAVVRVWSLVNLADGSWHLQLVRHLSHADPAREGSKEYRAPTVTAIVPTEKGVFVGDESGVVWEYNCVARQSRR